MSCINPIEMIVQTKYKGRQLIKTDCRHCLPCMIKRQQQIEFLCKKELNTVYRSGRSAAFVTLTYDDAHLPINDNGFVTLRRKDVQDFMKNMRRQMEYHKKKIPFKYIYCGEYGDGSHSTTKTGVSTHRPHYHLVFLGLSTAQIRKYTRKCWKHGICDIGELSAGGIRYLCKYMTKSCPDKDVKAFRQLCNVENPFFYHSVGIGKHWIHENLNKIVEDGFTFNIAGKKQLFPKYIMEYVSMKTGTSYIPYVRKFMQEEQLPKAHGQGITYSQYDFERSYVQHKMLVQNLRSQNKPINDVTLNKAYCKPVHQWDRKPYVDGLAENAHILGNYSNLYEVPKRGKISRKSVCDPFSNSIDWDKYLNVCKELEQVPF